MTHWYPTPRLWLRVLVAVTITFLAGCSHFDCTCAGSREWHVRSIGDHSQEWLEQCNTFCNGPLTPTPDHEAEAQAYHRGYLAGHANAADDYGYKSATPVPTLPCPWPRP